MDKQPKLIDEEKILVWLSGRMGNTGSDERYFAYESVQEAIEADEFDPDPIHLPTIKPGDKDADTANLIADLLFAFINKDADCPHDFEIKAFEDALNVLCKHYDRIKFNPKLFEDHLQSMRELIPNE